MANFNNTVGVMFHIRNPATRCYRNEVMVPLNDQVKAAVFNLASEDPDDRECALQWLEENVLEFGAVG